MNIPAKYEEWVQSVNLAQPRTLTYGGRNQGIIGTFFNSTPANCLSDVPLAPNLVTSFPFDWKMKTQQALLSTVMMCPFLSTATPLGPIKRPAPILFCERQKEKMCHLAACVRLAWGKASHFIFMFSAHLEFAIWGEDANPSVVVVSHNDVTIHVHCDPCGALQLARGPASDPKPHLELPVIWKHLEKSSSLTAKSTLKVHAGPNLTDMIVYVHHKYQL